ncbi:hypothetical protein BGZ63DRAFT_439371 [Mariannaea sp. PMI_226]|nr:hypothetical protein BGZ63DRAFT_439371 [Mariannaea sp. PMI_226]
MPDWYSLPHELRTIILELLTHHNNIASYATVSTEWRKVIEKKSFGRLRLHPSCLDSLERLAKRQQGLVKHIWLNIELKRYTCRCCRRMESVSWFYANNKIITAAITRLFSILATWNRDGGGGLVLELNAYSPSDSEHCQRLSTSVKRVKIFEDFNENYLELFQLSVGRNSNLNPDRVRITSPAVGAAFATESRQLEYLSVAFLADACHFFNACQPHWRWHQLHSLTLTSRIMCKTNPLQFQISKLLEAAAQTALNMPKLETLTLWNGAKGEACSFTWCRQDASLSWRGTWDFTLEPWVLKAWKTVAYQYARHEFTVNREVLTQNIGSHGDAIQYLGLHSVIGDKNICALDIAMDDSMLINPKYSLSSLSQY